MMYVRFALWNSTVFHVANCFAKQQHPYFNWSKKLVINSTRADVGSKTHFKHLYLSYPMCCGHFENSHYVDPAHTSLVPQTITTIFSSGIPNPPQMIDGLRPRRCSWRVWAGIAWHNTTHNGVEAFLYCQLEGAVGDETVTLARQQSTDIIFLVR